MCVLVHEHKNKLLEKFAMPITGLLSKKYDILFTASMYKSASNALRMAKSIQHIEGNHLCVFATPLVSDIYEFITGANDLENTILLFSHIDNIYFCRALGFLYAILNKMKISYYCSCDDDIEFTEKSSCILSILDSLDYAVMTFKSHGHAYKGFAGKEMTYNPPWINGDSMFSRFEDNIKYGLPDSLVDEPVTFFTEVEYQHRMRYLSRKKTIIDKRDEYYIHHFRERNNAITALRSRDSVHKMHSGNRFWKEKYGVDVDFIEDGNHDAVYRKTMQLEYIEKIKTHLIFGGLWNNWDFINLTFADSWHEAWSGKWA